MDLRTNLALAAKSVLRSSHHYLELWTIALVGLSASLLGVCIADTRGDDFRAGLTQNKACYGMQGEFQNGTWNCSNMERHGRFHMTYI